MLDRRPTAGRVVGEQIGAVFADLHRDHGVDLRLGTGVRGHGGDGTGVGATGRRWIRSRPTWSWSASASIPNVALAEAAGLDLAGGGVAVDAALRTSDPDIFAVGDIAAHAHPRYSDRVRVEHWANAKDQGTHVAAQRARADSRTSTAVLLLRPVRPRDASTAARRPGRDRVVVRGDLAGREFTAFWLREGAVAAAMNVNSVGRRRCAAGTGRLGP